MSFSISKQIFAQNNILEDSDILIGSHTGLSIYNMRYSSDDMTVFDHHKLIGGHFGIFAQYDYLWKGLSLRFDMSYATRGVKLSQNDINYSFRSHYFDMRFPVLYTFMREQNIQPYVIFAPNINFATGGKIQYIDDKSYKTKISKASIRPIDFSIFIGAGIRTPVYIKNQKFYVGGELGYNIGLCNTFSKMELNNNANAINLPKYKVEGTRKNGGFELSAMIAWVIPHNKNGNSDNNTIKYETKDCYTIEEVQMIIEEGKPINNIRICMFDMKFDFASSTLAKESKEQLDNFVKIFKMYPDMYININGHTDNVGSDEYNQKLSENRARSVYNYFVEKGISKDNMEINGFGSKYPISTNETDEGRAMNRRVEIDIQYKNK